MEKRIKLDENSDVKSDAEVLNKWNNKYPDGFAGDIPICDVDEISKLYISGTFVFNNLKSIILMGTVREHLFKRYPLLYHSPDKSKIYYHYRDPITKKSFFCFDARRFDVHQLSNVLYAEFSTSQGETIQVYDLSPKKASDKISILEQFINAPRENQENREIRVGRKKVHIRDFFIKPIGYGSMFLHVYGDDITIEQHQNLLHIRHKEGSTKFKNDFELCDEWKIYASFSGSLGGSSIFNRAEKNVIYTLLLCVEKKGISHTLFSIWLQMLHYVSPQRMNLIMWALSQKKVKCFLCAKKTLESLKCCANCLQNII
jgi:hypothetical protein